MDIVHLLPDSIANQIAAGEVVQRPASVVKELMENAIDAGAKNIQVILKNVGKAVIQVIDDGKGMSPMDARMAFERHATSKISSAQDLFNIQTLGFRGEALPSIASVAEVELKTRQATDELGTCIFMAASELKGQEAVNTPAGTNIAVKNLFYNINIHTCQFIIFSYIKIRSKRTTSHTFYNCYVGVCKYSGSTYYKACSSNTCR